MGTDETAEDAELRESLLRHYLGSADVKIARIEAALFRLRVAGSEVEQREAVEHAYTTLHTLAGNAGTYGFPEITARARALVKALRAETGCTPALLGEFERFREEVQVAFDAARERLPPEAPSSK